MSITEKLTPPPSGLRPGCAVVAYLRDSGHENQELSIPQQTSVIRQYCLDHALDLRRVYADTGSGTTDRNRDELAQMMNDLRHGLDITGILVWSSARLARNSMDAQFYRAEIRKLGYIYHSLTGKTIDGPETIIFEAFDDYVSQRYSENLGIEIRRGLHDLVHVHRCNPGIAPLGFNRIPVNLGQHRDGTPRTAHRWEPDPAYIPRILLAFELRARGTSLKEIERQTHLYASLNGYRSFFANKIYMGTLVYDGEEIPDFVTPMVSAELWEQVKAVQNGYTNHRHTHGDSAAHPRRVSSTYLLSGLGYCAKCGAPLFGHSYNRLRDGGKTIYYSCTRAYNKRDCVKQRIPGNLVEKSILTALKEHLLQPEQLTAAEQEIRASKNSQLEIERREREKLNADLRETRRQLTNLANAIKDGGHTRVMINELQKLEAREIELTIQIADLENKQLREITPVTNGRAAQLLNLLERDFPNFNIQDQRTILRTLIQSVHVDKTGPKISGTITVYYLDDDDPLSQAQAPDLNSAGGLKLVRTLYQASAALYRGYQNAPILPIKWQDGCVLHDLA